MFVGIVCSIYFVFLYLLFMYSNICYYYLLPPSYCGYRQLCRPRQAIRVVGTYVFKRGQQKVFGTVWLGKKITSPHNIPLNVLSDIITYTLLKYAFSVNSLGLFLESEIIYVSSNMMLPVENDLRTIPQFPNLYSSSDIYKVRKSDVF